MGAANSGLTVRLGTVLESLYRHPLARRHRWRSLGRFLRWQLHSRAWPGPFAVDFVGHAKLWVERGMTGASGNVYLGLHEFEDMAFVVHCLRADELFVDVGANVGVYTVLASLVAGARCVACEPVESAFAWLERNVDLNGVRERVMTWRMGVGSEEGTLGFTSDAGPMNRVVEFPRLGCAEVQVPVTTLDTLLSAETPRVVKVDVEGFETEVVAGADRLLSRPGLLAVVMEQNGAGARYGHDESSLRDCLSRRGFEACRYLPFERRLAGWCSAADGANVIFVRRDAREDVEQRVGSAPPFEVLGELV